MGVDVSRQMLEAAHHILFRAATRANELARERIAVSATMLAAAAVIEAILLPRIVFHQAGGWGEPESIYPFVLAGAAIPFIWSAVLIGVVVLRRIPPALVVALFMVVVFAGPLLGYMALVQYGPATPVLMVVGLVLQCIALLEATARMFMSPIRMPHGDPEHEEFVARAMAEIRSNPDPKSRARLEKTFRELEDAHSRVAAVAQKMRAFTARLERDEAISRRLGPWIPLILFAIALVLLAKHFFWSR